MPLQGNMRDFSATQLFNLINLSGRTGALVIYDGRPTGEKDAMGNEKMAPGQQRASVTFKSGKLVHADLVGQHNDLIAVLNKAGKLTDQQAKIIRERAKGTSDKALAMRLIGANYVSQGEIVSSIQQYTLDVVYNLMGWNKGPFRFDDNAQLPSDRILVPIDLENVIIEGARRIRETEELEKHLPNLDMALKFPEKAREKFKGIHLGVDEWKIVSFVNPKNTIRQIAKANNMNDLEIRRVIYGLEQAGLVLVVPPEGASRKVATSQQGRSKRKRQQPVQRDVVSKLIDRLKSI